MSKKISKTKKSTNPETNKGISLSGITAVCLLSALIYGFALEGGQNLTTNFYQSFPKKSKMKKQSYTDYKNAKVYSHNRAYYKIER